MSATQRVTVLGPNLPASMADKGTLHVHAEGCADIARRYSKVIERDGWSFEAKSILAVVADIYEPDNFGYDITDPADREQYVSDVHFAPCVHLPFEAIDDLPDVQFAAPLTHPGGVPADEAPVTAVHSCSECGYVFTRPQAKCRSARACQRRQEAKAS